MVKKVTPRLADRCIYVSCERPAVFTIEPVVEMSDGVWQQIERKVFISGNVCVFIFQLYIRCHFDLLFLKITSIKY